MSERMDSFKKPFRAVPVQLGEKARARQRQENRQMLIGTAVRLALATFLVFTTGMVITNFGLSRYLPTGLFDATNGTRPANTYFPNCSAARATGHAPIRAGSPGYRIGLDADGDGIACEPYVDR